MARDDPVVVGPPGGQTRVLDAVRTRHEQMQRGINTKKLNQNQVEATFVL